MNKNFPSVVTKTAVVHTVSYFIVGLVSSIFLDYSAKYADPIVAGLMRQVSDPWVAAGPMFQLLRGILLGIVFYALREIIFPSKRGWLTLWMVLTIVGIFSTFGPSPSSIEGMIYTIIPFWFHVSGFPEMFIQAGLLALLTHYWVNHPEKKWFGWVFGILLVIVILLSILGTLSAAGMLPQAG